VLSQAPSAWKSTWCFEKHQVKRALTLLKDGEDGGVAWSVYA